MSVQIGVFFDKQDVEKLISSLMTLPEALIPKIFSSSENRKYKKDQVADKERFESFKQRNPAGFFLYAESCTYNLFIHSKGYSILYVDEFKFGQDYKLIRHIFRATLSVRPVFGYAAEFDERKHRNVYEITIGMNHIEDGVGRDPDKYIPGVYWQTLLPDALLSKHHVDLASLETEAISSETLGDGSFHLLKFYESPDDWKLNAERLDNLCQRTDGIFSKKSVELAVAGVETFQEYDDIIFEWR